MAKVNVQEEIKKAENIKKELKNIEATRVGDKTFFKGKFVDESFDDYGECVRANEAAVRLEEYKKNGLNEHGQDKKGVEKSKKIKALIARKAELDKETQDIDVQISLINLDQDEKETTPKK